MDMIRLIYNLSQFQLGHSVTELWKLNVFSAFVYFFLPYMVGVLSVDCTGRKDGVYERGCKAFTKCVNETAEIVNCINNTRFNPDKNECDYEFHVPPPCGTYRECVHLADGNYPDIEHMCTSFYTCLGGIFLGHTPCAPGLVFNQGLQVCDWPFNVTKPCGVL
ncbi:unnamed protein product [Mytilus coruscus]|uniref:Chitin-binding type-2 domain-containing protein n=1 Tax=Mytilus coruscus TaxID=42192 RepID=A0A6J8AV03_MYTCO|nr:unnamed protein product [Mytilus coruscus]